MALVKCQECKGKVSTEAEACPHCGYKHRQESQTSPQVVKPAQITKKTDRGWLPCQRCGSSRVQCSSGSGSFGIAIGGIGVGFVFLFLFPPIAVLFFAVGALALIWAFLLPIGQAIAGRGYECQDCKKIYRVKGRKYV